VTVIDIELTEAHGIQAVESIRHEFPYAKIIALSCNARDSQEPKAGFPSYVLSSADSSKLTRAIRYMYKRNNLAGVRVIEEAPVCTEVDVLTEREIEIIQAVAAGNSNRDVARKLSVGLETVKAHLKHISTKLRTRDRAHAVATAIKLGLIDP
jgi:DNA-binding NarL/FixJ family response regulator